MNDRFPSCKNPEGDRCVRRNDQHKRHNAVLLLNVVPQTRHTRSPVPRGWSRILARRECGPGLTCPRLYSSLGQDQDSIPGLLSPREMFLLWGMDKTPSSPHPACLETPKGKEFTQAGPQEMVQSAASVGPWISQFRKTRQASVHQLTRKNLLHDLPLYSLSRDEK